VLGEDLDRDLAAEPRVLGAVDLAHAAGTERGDDFIGTETRAGRKTHERTMIGDGNIERKLGTPFERENALAANATRPPRPA
jgi:hypothetical protein